MTTTHRDVDQPVQTHIPAVFDLPVQPNPKPSRRQKIEEEKVGLKRGTCRLTSMVSLSCQESFIETDTRRAGVPTRPILEEISGETARGKRLRDTGGAKALERRGNNASSRAAPTGFKPAAIFGDFRS